MLNDKHLSLKYLVKSFSIFKLLSNKLRFETAISRVTHDLSSQSSLNRIINHLIIILFMLLMQINGLISGDFDTRGLGPTEGINVLGTTCNVICLG